MTRKFSFTTTEIPGLTLIQAFCAEDERGYFLKDYSRELFEQNGISHDLQEVFYTRSHKGVIRALHFQREKQQPKLVRCIVGRIYDVVVDLRMDSPHVPEMARVRAGRGNPSGTADPGGLCAWISGPGTVHRFL